MLSFYLIIVLFWVITTLTATSSTVSPTPEPVKLTSVFAEITPTTAQGGQHRSDGFELSCSISGTVAI